MKILISNNKLNLYEKQIEISNSLGVSYITENHINDLFISSERFVLIGSVNNSFRKELLSSTTLKETIENSINKLVNGFIIYIDKESSDLIIYTDIFNFHHLFYFQDNENFYISSDFKSIAKLTHSTSINEFSLLDMYLFNYCLLNRTILKDIKRFYGGSKITIEGNKIKEDVINNYAQNFIANPKMGSSKIRLNKYVEIFTNICKEEVNVNYPLSLSITGGIDSRMILAANTFLQNEFSSFTFGQQGNIESKMADPFIQSYSTNHQLIELNNSYVQEIDEHLESIIRESLDNPTILDLAHYSLVKNNYSNYNLVFGYLGGELLLGQSDGAQVTFTHFATKLLTCKSLEQLTHITMLELKKDNVFSNEFLEEHLFNYTKTLNTYLHVENNSNIHRFLLNEKYSKFFGTVNKIVGSQNNLISPFVHKEIADLYLNSNLSFLNKKPFNKQPFLNMKGKFFQGMVIKKLAPSLGKTKFDRRYSVNDLANPLLRAKTLWGYIQNHLFKANKKSHLAPHDCDTWYENFVVSNICDGKRKFNEIFNKEFILSCKVYKGLNPNEKKRMASLAAFINAEKQILKSIR